MKNRQKILKRAAAGAELCFWTRLDKAGGREAKKLWEPSRRAGIQTQRGRRENRN